MLRALVEEVVTPKGQAECFRTIQYKDIMTEVEVVLALYTPAQICLTT